MALRDEIIICFRPSVPMVEARKFFRDWSVEIIDDLDENKIMVMKTREGGGPIILKLLNNECSRVIQWAAYNLEAQTFIK